jgi:hypothetical protein
MKENRTMNQEIIEGVSQEQYRQIEAKLKLEKQAKGGANWFYWIAGLSILNSVLVLLGISLNFVVGLGITQFIDGIALANAMDIGNDGASIVRLLAFLFDLGIAMVFVGFGYFARKRQMRSFYIGMAFYALDAVLFLIVMDILSLVFHLFALLGLYGGVKASRLLKDIDTGGIEPDDVVKYSQQQDLGEVWTKLKSNRLALIILGFFAIILILTLVFLPS